MADGHRIHPAHHVLTVQVIAPVVPQAATPALQIIGITPVITTVPAIWVAQVTIIAIAPATPVIATTPVRLHRRTTTIIIAAAHRITAVVARVLRLITATRLAIHTTQHHHSTAVLRTTVLAVAE